MDKELSNPLLSEIVGHSSQLEDLMRMLDSDCVPHALLFNGPSGVGKRTLARAFAASLLLSRGGNTPDHARSLSLIRSGNHPDLHFLFRPESKKDITVESVRSLCNTLHLKPYCSSCSVVIIDDAHLMNIAASNALLMTLEEPTSPSYILVITDAIHRLPETIVSRCQVLHFGELKKQDLLEILRNVLYPILDDESSLEDLLLLLSGSLEPLQLSQFVEEKTLRLTNTKELRDHLRALAQETRNLKHRLEQVASSRSLRAPVSLACDFAANRENAELLWHVLRLHAREQMRQAQASEKAAWANLLLDITQGEQRVKERNTTPQLELSSLLLDMSDI